MFSNATIVDLMNLLKDMNTNTTLEAFSLRYGLDEILVGNSKDKKVMNLARYLIDNPKTPGLLSDNLLLEIAEKIISEATSGYFYYEEETNEFRNYPELRRLLLKDGFVIEESKLIRTFETDIDFQTNETLLERLLNKHNLTTAKGHYNQASNAFNRGDWAACNAQLRTYVEELMIKLAEKITGKDFKDKSYQAKIALSKANPPIFYRELNEWKDNRTGYFETFWDRLSPHGSHPGLSDEDDSIFRLHLVQISTLEILKRFDKHYR
ncbi:hypothetical protein PUS82_00505 [Cytobacillus firmus]|uniref:hypothetical protein n=1 Tax=Cytobacillus firmus TaxID=1399 RepID=UPI00237AE838|nr:hypothetical protein [Cytobacillus firmus]MDD9309812.1 hypothetical protein [Cytobacillus firmus]